MIESLKFIQERLNKLHDEERVRHEGNTVFQEARQELASVIGNYRDVTQAPAPIIQQVMSEEQVAAVIGSIPKVGNYESVITGLAEHILPAIRAEIEQSDVTVLAAIADSQADIIAVIPQPAEQA